MDKNIWSKSESGIYRRNLGEQRFEFVEVKTIPRFTDDEDEADLFYIAASIISLKSYSTEDITKYLNDFNYSSIDYVKKLYGVTADEIIAECIFKSTVVLSVNEPWFIKPEEASEHAISKYMIAN